MKRLFCLFTLLVPSTLAAGVPLPAVQGPVDVSGYRTLLIDQVDRWNGGPDGNSGLGAYRQTFDGGLHLDLDQSWQPRGSSPVTAVAQARALYMNLEAYRASSELRFKTVLEKTFHYLQNHFLDRKYGGYYWEVGPGGDVTNRDKQGYGNMHILMVLAQAADATHDPAYLKAALTQLEVVEKRFGDKKYPGGVKAGFNYDFSEVRGVNNVDTFTHYFEALLALEDVTTGQERVRVNKGVNEAANFLVRQLYRNEAGLGNRGYVAYNYDESWNPAQAPYTRATQWSGASHASPGHGIELAYLLSRAVERGHDPKWLETADRLLRFVDAHALDAKTGGMLFDTTDYLGKPLKGNPDNDFYVWWAQAETARASLHFSVVRGEKRWPEFLKAQKLILTHFLDPHNGGWFQNVRARDLSVPDTTKGNIWTMNYHESMYYAEILRLARVYPKALAALK